MKGGSWLIKSIEPQLDKRIGSSEISVGKRNLTLPSRRERHSYAPPPRGGRIQVGVEGGFWNVTHGASWAVWVCDAHLLTS